MVKKYDYMLQFYEVEDGELTWGDLFNLFYDFLNFDIEAHIRL
jgi:hypothetical protein